MISVKKVIANYRVSATEKKTVGINNYVKNQTKSDFSGTKVSMAELDDLRRKAEEGVNSGKDKEGYKPYVRIVTIKDPKILSNIAKITSENKKFLKTEMTRRQKGEEEYEHSFFESKDVKGVPSHHIDLILYTKEQLEKEKSNPTGSDFDLISVNAEFSDKSVPMTPVTMRRNIKGPAFGGSGHKHSEKEIAGAEKFWKDHAFIK